MSPIRRSLTVEAAREIVQLRADDELQQRFDELAEKNSEGQLTPEERDAYAELVAAFNIITILQTRARSVLDGSDAR